MMTCEWTAQDVFMCKRQQGWKDYVYLALFDHPRKRNQAAEGRDKVSTRPLMSWIHKTLSLAKGHLCHPKLCCNNETIIDGFMNKLVRK